MGTQCTARFKGNRRLGYLNEITTLRQFGQEIGAEDLF